MKLFRITPLEEFSMAGFWIQAMEPFIISAESKELAIRLWLSEADGGLEGAMNAEGLPMIVEELKEQVQYIDVLNDMTDHTVADHA